MPSRYSNWVFGVDPEAEKVLILLGYDAAARASAVSGTFWVS